MSIKSYVDELGRLNAEIKHNNIRNKDLRKRVSELELNITEYLKSKEQNGLKYNGQAIIIENKEKHSVKKKKDKHDDVTLFLRTLGIDDPEKAYQQLQDIQKGALVEHQRLTFKKI